MVQNLLQLLQKQRGLNLNPMQPSQPSPDYPMNPMQIAAQLQDSPSDFGDMPPMDESALDGYDIGPVAQSIEQGDAEPIETNRIAPAIQEWLGTKQPDMGGLVKQLLSARQGQTSEDAARAATASATSGKYVSGQDYADNRFKDDFATIASLAKLQSLGGGGNSVFAQTMAAINADPQLARMSPIDKIRMAQNKIGTNLTYDPATGKVIDMSGAAQGLGNLEFGKQSGGNQSDLIYKPQIGAETKKAEGMVKKQFDAPGAKAALDSTTATQQIVLDTIDTILPKVNEWTTGYVGDKLSNLSGTDAADLQNNLNTIRANVGFDKLAEMRANSPTGGALGNVSDTENRLLASTMAAVEQSQSPQQLTQNLKLLKTRIAQSNERIRDAYLLDYGTTEGAPQLGEPSVTATSPNVIKYDAQGNRL